MQLSILQSARRQSYPFAFAIIFCIGLFVETTNVFSQGVGINTTQPDPSAVLDIVGVNKGLLIPRVSLQSVSDNSTIPNPATALLVYNTNVALGKAGFYFNAGTSESPSWSLISEGGSLTLPFSQSGSSISSLFHINNTGGISVGSAITGESESSVGVKGQTLTGDGIFGRSDGSGSGVTGYTSSTGTGVSASAANTNGKALEVSGPVKIAGPGQSPGKGKVFTSDENGNATWENVAGNVAFKAVDILGNGSQNVAVQSSVKVPFAIEVYDFTGDYKNSSQSPHSSFTAPEKGIYHFDVRVGWECPSGCSFKTGLDIKLTRNGNTSVIETDVIWSPTSSFNTISTDVLLEQGDVVNVQAYNISNSEGETLIMVGGNFSGRLIVKQ
ncbi:hypothetical protein LZG74_17195 [Dyadobacter sp. CY327]|uniref:hypothetical protein n=1 Tax=Dyadobacter sp. CY327 TaxID=2907301 RepID=UPI001F26A8D5|nr:hypothetical protein [Dyadobacter sp. CY327]MCE7072056.1 hypothetical protein [Dyadobacter sp. CY327]